MSESENQPQSVRLENELKALRAMFKSAEVNEDGAQMVQLSRVILQHEKEISKLKLSEGRTLTEEAVMQYQNRVVHTISEVAKKFMADDRYNEFIDTLVVRLEQDE